jgi:membrane fusion protein, heavy metal efflux system
MFHRDVVSSFRSVVVALALGAGATTGGGPGTILAHENHAPLPTKGVKVVGDQIMISAKGREAIGLTTAKIALGNLSRTVSVNAKVELPWRQQAMIASLVPGKVERVLVRPGETVACGQELARVASMELESLQSEMLQLAAEAAVARRVLEQRTLLESQGAIAGKGLLEAKVLLALKTTQLEIARHKLIALGFDERSLAQMQASGQTTGWLSITSPIGGVIVHADLRVGQVIQPSDHLYHVVDPSTVWIVGEALEADVGNLRTGQEVKASFAGLAGRTFVGKIDHVRLKMDQRWRTQSVVIAIDNRENLLRPGMFGRADIEVQLAKEAIFCPTDALIETRHAVYVLAQRGEGKFVSQPVKLGLQHGGRVEILDGVFPGDQVVVVGNYLLASLMGNEHKARVAAGKTETVGLPQEVGEGQRLVVQATIELPTDRQAFATSRIEGRVARILVAPSQAVRAGQVLAEVASLQLQNQQLELLQAAARMQWTKDSISRLDGLSQEGTPKRQVWQLQNDLEVLKQTVGAIRRKLVLLGLTDEQVRRLEETDARHAAEAIVAGLPVRAPADGWLVGFDVVPGQVIQPQDKLFEIHDLSKVWAKGYVFERDAERVRVGQTVRVTFSAYPELVATGKVVRRAPTMETSERVLPVWIEVDNPELRLKQGMLARVAVGTQQSSEALTAHRTADRQPLTDRNREGQQRQSSIP